MGETRRRKQGKWLGYTEAATVGLEMAVAVAIGGAGGLYLESHVTHWSPWTSLIGLGLGIGAAINAVVRVARNLKNSGSPPEAPSPDPPSTTEAPDTAKFPPQKTRETPDDGA